MQTLSPPTLRLLDAFDEAAQAWGWESDQGTGVRVQNALDTYTATKKALVQRLLQVERHSSFNCNNAENA